MRTSGTGWGSGFFLIFGQALSIYASPIPKDTIPPAGRWIAPQAFAVITTSQVRVAVEAQDPPSSPTAEGSGVDRVVFYATYFENTGHYRKREKIGEALHPPYEVIWDCSRVQDHSFGRLKFSGEIFDRAGNRQSMLEMPGVNVPPGRSTESQVDSLGRVLREEKEEFSGNLTDRWKYFILDRNSAFSAKELHSLRTRKKITVDGILEDWDRIGAESISFDNNDNRITIRSAWDGQSLYFALVIRDQSLIVPPEWEIDSVFMDQVEIYIDVNRGRGEMMPPGDIQVTFRPNGRRFICVRDTYTTKEIYDPGIPAAITAQGTLNHQADADTGFVIECSIPWSRIGRHPFKGLAMGFEAVIIDLDFLDGKAFLSSWNKLSANLPNPSEWGTLVLAGDTPSPWVWAGIILFMAGLAGGAIWFRVKRRREIAALVAPDGKITSPIKEQIHSHPTVSEDVVIF
jgi:hypothetical protein